MRRTHPSRLSAPALAALACAGLALTAATTAPRANAAELLTNGSFETGLVGWTVANQANGSGSWYVQTGTTSPQSGFPVPAPPDGSFAAMADQNGPGSHVLYQDFLVPTSISSATLNFDRFINNQAGTFSTPNTLDYNVSPNQQARVDILSLLAAGPFSVAAGDVLLNVFQTQVGDPAVSGYTTQATDLTAFLQAHTGETLRLRFAQVDNQSNFQFGVDKVSLDVVPAAPGGDVVPEPGTLALALTGLLPLAGAVVRKRRRTVGAVAWRKYAVHNKGSAGAHSGRAFLLAGRVTVGSGFGRGTRLAIRFENRPSHPVFGPGEG